MILCVMMAATGAIGIRNMRYEFLGDLVPLYIIALLLLGPGRNAFAKFS